MMVKREKFAKHAGGNFNVAMSLVAVPVIMGLALAVDVPRIEGTTKQASVALSAAVEASLSADGRFDADRANQLYASTLELPEGQYTSAPRFRRTHDGRMSASVTAMTRLTLGGVVLPETFHRPVTVTVGSGG